MKLRNLFIVGLVLTLMSALIPGGLSLDIQPQMFGVFFVSGIVLGLIVFVLDNRKFFRL